MRFFKKLFKKEEGGAALLPEQSANQGTVRQEILDLFKEYRSFNTAVREASFKKLIALGAPGVQPLIDALSDNDEETCRLAADILREIGDPSAVEALLIAVGRDTTSYGFCSAPKIAEGAIERIAETAPTVVLDRCLAALHNPNRQIRQFATRMVGQFKEPRAVDDLISLLDDPEESGTSSTYGGPHPGFRKHYYDQWGRTKTSS